MTPEAITRRMTSLDVSLQEAREELEARVAAFAARCAAIAPYVKESGPLQRDLGALIAAQREVNDLRAAAASARRELRLATEFG